MATVETNQKETDRAKRLNGDPERRTHINLDISSKFELTCTTNVTFEMHDSSREQNTNTLKWMN